MALNTTDPLVKEYFINDRLHFSWIVKHGNGSYETAKNVSVSFSFPTSVDIETINASGVVHGSWRLEKPGEVVFTPADNNLPIGIVSQLIDRWIHSFWCC